MRKTLLDILVCPVCKGRLYYDETRQTLHCRFDRLIYPISDGVPVLIMEQAWLEKRNR